MLPQWRLRATQMATHQCTKCLKKTHEDGILADSSFVHPDSVCEAPPRDGPHEWSSLHLKGIDFISSNLLVPCRISLLFPRSLSSHHLFVHFFFDD